MSLKSAAKISKMCILGFQFSEKNTIIIALIIHVHYHKQWTIHLCSCCLLRNYKELKFVCIRTRIQRPTGQVAATFIHVLQNADIKYYKTGYFFNACKCAKKAFKNTQYVYQSSNSGSCLPAVVAAKSTFLFIGDETSRSESAFFLLHALPAFGFV